MHIERGFATVRKCYAAVSYDGVLICRDMVFKWFPQCFGMNIGIEGSKCGGA